MKNGGLFENNKKNTLVTILILALFFSGCAGSGDKIGDILSSPNQYNDREVNIRGDVIEVLSIPFVSQGAYKVDDGTGSIWAVTSSGTPGKGKTVSVKGTVKTAFTIASINLGIVVFENKRS